MSAHHFDWSFEKVRKKKRNLSSSLGRILSQSGKGTYHLDLGNLAQVINSWLREFHVNICLKPCSILKLSKPAKKV